MRKKVTNDEVGKVVEQVAEKIRDEMDYEFRVAQSQMWIAEKDFIECLNEEQKEKYQEYCKKRNEFFAIAGEIYQRKY